MIFLTSMAIGLTAGLMRSVMAALVAVFLIVLAYGAAVLFSGTVSLRWLVYAILASISTSFPLSYACWRSTVAAWPKNSATRDASIRA